MADKQNLYIPKCSVLKQAAEENQGELVHSGSLGNSR